MNKKCYPIKVAFFYFIRSSLRIYKSNLQYNRFANHYQHYQMLAQFQQVQQLGRIVQMHNLKLLVCCFLMQSQNLHQYFSKGYN